MVQALEALKNSIYKKEKVQGCKKHKEKRASGILADATVGPKSQKSLKQTNLTDFHFFLEQNELLKIFGETLDRFH